MNQQHEQFCRYEKGVVRLWRSGDISAGTVSTYLAWIRRFYIYCAERSIDPIVELTLEGARRFACSYIGPRTKGHICVGTRLSVRNALHAWAFALGRLGAAAPEWSPKHVRVPKSRLLKEYCEFRRCHRGVAEGTLQRDFEVARAFLLLLRTRGKSVNRTAISDLDAFVRQEAQRESGRTLATTCGCLRSFLRFLRSTGRLHRDLACCVIGPRVRASEKPPRALPWPEVKRILGCVQTARSPGKRDFAMLLMMALYGLGAAEILALRFEDVNWKTGIIDVRRPKTGVRIELPLLPPVAKALGAYLQKERSPAAQTRRLFVSTMIPYRSLTSSAIRHRIREYARKAGVTAKMIGAHAFRYAHASRQIDIGADLKVVSDILGHRRPSSTSVYVRVAIRRLRTVGLPVPK